MRLHLPSTGVALMSALAAILTLIVVAAGLLVPDFYHMPSRDLLIGVYAQDLVALLIAVRATRRGSLRGLMVWAGCLAYLVYGYLLYSFDRVFTPLYPVYIAIMSLSIYSLTVLLARLDGPAFAHQVRPGMPVRLIAVVLFSPAVVVVPWIAGLIDTVRTGTPSPYNSIIVLDLGLLIPACIYSAVQLWQRKPWGLILGGVLLVKAASLGWSLTLGMLYYHFLIAPHPDLVQLPFYAFLALFGAYAVARYLQHLAGDSGRVPHARSHASLTGC